MRYTPFNKTINEFSETDLGILRGVSEGWYVEYKSELPKIRDVAKSLSSFANQYGGWLFIGVEEDKKSKTAAGFPGTDIGNVPEILESIRNAAKDVVRPQVSYECRSVNGPIESINLPKDRSVIVIYVPEGANTPYIHNDGRIYIRNGDSSSPISAKDKSTFDLLYQRGEDIRSYLKELVERSPEISKGEEETSFIHLSILSDPYGTLGHRYTGTYSDFSTVMKSSILPFDNIYTAPGGFIARQVGNNVRYNRVLTWEFSKNCNSFVTIPIPILVSQQPDDILEDDVTDAWGPYSISRRFLASLIAKGLQASRILNVNLLLLLLSGIITRHRILMGPSRVTGPFYIKARIDNVWRAVPFIDLDEYMDHLEMFDFPVVQDSELMVPVGTSLETFVVAPELDSTPSESDPKMVSQSVGIWSEIMQALGIPVELLRENAEALVNISFRESEIQRARGANKTEDFRMLT